MELTPHAQTHGFTVLTAADLPEIEGVAYTAIHEASGARLLYLKNDDSNKSFAIGFRTPPQDDTGVFHILEHSVLCGSERFPVKEPFVDLLKSSMQTFLNAMTFADKTLYPVASTNEQDLFNLMDVYMDAVFHPRIYQKKAIFEQEGWHLELSATDTAITDIAAAPREETLLTYNGVVYNEMKGALSDAGSVLYDAVQARLFPDTCYAFESGGTPQAIPTLTYEGFLDEHRRHYRTNNAYIILYGDLDIDRTLAFLDERYLSPVAAEQAQRDKERTANGKEALLPREVGLQAPLVAPFERITMDTAPENACAACGFVIGRSDERKRVMACDILLDALLGSNESPLKRALLDRGIAHDITAAVSDALRQPFVYVQVQMPAPQAGASLAAVLAEETQKLLDGGLDKQVIDAALSHAEFQLREHELGMADGVVYAIQSLSSWLYDDEAPLDYIRYRDMFAELREDLEGGYFEELLAELFCRSDHCASVELLPTPGESDDRTEEQLAQMNAAMSAEERQAIVEEEALLRKLQEAPDSPEALATLPRLSLTDIQQAPAEPPYKLIQDAPLPCLRHTMATHGIAYATRYFDAALFTFEELPYLALLALVLGKLDTSRHSASQLDTLVQAKLGNLSFYLNVFEVRDDPQAFKARFVVSASALSIHSRELNALPLEVMTETLFTDKAKVLDILKQRKIGLEQGFINSGHLSALARLKSYYSPAGEVSEQVSNVGFYRFICELIENFDARADELLTTLRDLCPRVFCDDTCLVSFAGSDADLDAFWDSGAATGLTSSGKTLLSAPKPTVRNEAFILPSDVCFAAAGWDRRALQLKPTGHWLVAARALTYGYLWNEVRVKGGAYGVGFQALRQGDTRYYSFRDPHLDQTLRRFSESTEWLHSLKLSQEELDGFVVATVATLDAPLKARALMLRQDGDYFFGATPIDRLALREEAIQTTTEEIHKLAPAIAEMLAQDNRCVFGNRDILESSKLSWQIVELMG